MEPMNIFNVKGIRDCQIEILSQIFECASGTLNYLINVVDRIYVGVGKMTKDHNRNPSNKHTVASPCYHTLQILISDFIKFKENQE